MASCKFCEKSGLFLRLNSNGLCKRCAPAVKSEASGHIRVINDSYKLITESKNVETVKGRLDLVIERCEYLESKYQSKGINIMKPSPKEHLKHYRNNYDQYIAEVLEREYEKLLEKVSNLKTKRGKVNNIEKYIDRLNEFKNELEDKKALQYIEDNVEKRMPEIILNTEVD